MSRALTVNLATATAQGLMPAGWNGVITVVNGQVVIAAPNANPTLTINVKDGGIGIIVNDPGAVSGAYLSWQNSGVERGFIGTGPATLAGAALADFTIGANTGVLRLIAGGLPRITIPASGAIVIPAPTGGSALDITGVASNNAVFIHAPNTASVSFGLVVDAGTNTTDRNLLLRSAAGTNYLLMNGVGSILLAAATGGQQGNGTLNATQLYVNGNPLFQEGTFVGTVTGLTAVVTGTFKYTIAGNIATIALAATTTGTSNTVGMSVTGLPAVLTPVSAQHVMCAQMEDNTIQPLYGKAAVSGTTVVFSLATVATGQFNTFSAAGTKGLIAGWTITYPLN